MMDKNQEFKKLLAKGIPQKEIDEKFDNAVKYFKEIYKEDQMMGIDKIEQYALSKIMSHYKKILFSPSRTFEGIIYGIDRETDYGAGKQWDESVKMRDADMERAIAEGYVDADGNPLYHGKRAPKSGTRKIDLDNDRGKPIYLVAKTIDGENQDKDYRRAVLTLKSDKFETELPLFRKIKFRAIKGNKSTEDFYALNQSQETKFELISDEEVPFSEIAKKYLREHICPSLKKLVDWHKKYEDDANRQVIIKGNVTDVRITQEGISNIVTLNADELDIEDKPITCWIPEDVPLNFDENAMDVIVVGKTGLKEDDDKESVFLNAVCVWCPPVFRIERNGEEQIDEDKIQEKVVAETEEEKELDEEVKKVIEGKPKQSAKPAPVKTKKKVPDDDLFDDADVGDW